jgi:hypothetical protein
MNLMLINVSTRKLRRAVRLPEGDLPVIPGTEPQSQRLAPVSSHCRLNGWPSG